MAEGTPGGRDLGSAGNPWVAGGTPWGRATWEKGPLGSKDPMGAGTPGCVGSRAVPSPASGRRALCTRLTLKDTFTL